MHTDRPVRNALRENSLTVKRNGLKTACALIAAAVTGSALSTSAAKDARPQKPSLLEGQSRTSHVRMRQDDGLAAWAALT